MLSWPAETPMFSPTPSARAAHISSAIPAPERGQFSSLQIGLRELLDRGCNAAMITPVDCPPLGSASLERLHHAFLGALTAGFWAVAPENDGKHGHPLLVSRELIDAFLKAPVPATRAKFFTPTHPASSTFRFLSRWPRPASTRRKTTPPSPSKVIRKLRATAIAIPMLRASFALSNGEARLGIDPEG